MTAAAPGTRGSAGLLSLVLLVPLLLLAQPLAHAEAAGTDPSVVVVTSTPARAGSRSVLTVQVSGRAQGGVPGARVRVERHDGAGWRPAAVLTTNAAGRATWQVSLDRSPDRNRLRVLFDGDERWAASSAEHTLTLLRTPAALTLGAPRSVVDERTGVIRVRWVTTTHQGVAGQVVVQRKVRYRTGWTKSWADFRRLTTDVQGHASLGVRPRWTTKWRVVAAPLAWAEGGTSAASTTRNLSPARPVTRPKSAPRPTITLPPQQRASGSGAHVVVTTIPSSVWRSMVGRSWHRGCPLGRADLRLVRTNYWAFDGYRRRGELVVAASASGTFVDALTALYAAKVPIRSIRRVDTFGYSKTLRGADDLRSMAADNTSAFNCRRVVGNPRATSPHAYGRSLDLNPWENPYRSRWGIVPNRWWASHSDARVAWRSSNHAVVRLMRRRDFSWTYGAGDLHHFDAVGANRSLAALLDSAACTEQVCH